MTDQMELEEETRPVELEEETKPLAFEEEPVTSVNWEAPPRLALPQIIALLLIGGVVGWFLGRQSVRPPVTEVMANAAIEATAVAVATEGDAPTAVPTTIPLLTDDASSSAASIVPVGPTPATISPETVRVMGDPNAPVTIVEFSDYQCPFCLRHFQETYPQLKAEYIDTGKVYFVFKDFPLTNIHPNAPRAAEAARCAGEFGESVGYWRAHDSLFNGQQQWADLVQPDLDATLVNLVAGEGVSPEDIEECLADGRYSDEVSADFAEGQQLGITGTPAFFINGYPISGAQPLELFQQAIALAEAGTLGEAYTYDQAAQAPPTAVPLQAADIPLGDAPAKGNPDAPITIVEYSDFQCPYCLRFFTDTMPQLQAYIDAKQVYFVYKDFPLHSIHPQAQKAHEAARCARELGGDEGYWTMHDLLFINQQQWAGNANHVAVLKTLANEAGLPQTEFDTCLDSGRYAEAVNADVAEGIKLGIRGTPTFFINGQPLVGAQPFAVFEQILGPLPGANE